VERLVIAGFELEHDPEATRRAWATVSQGAAGSCGCALCRASLVGRAELLPAEVLELLPGLGLSLGRESELALLEGDPGRGPTRVLLAWAFAGRLLRRPRGPGPLEFREDPHFAPAGLLPGPLLSLEVECLLPGPPRTRSGGGVPPR
jgi:hypothetical protein